MAQDNTLQKEAIRDIDPNVLQARASSPDASSWVSASAGSGKTKVLTERILRLLLPDQEGQNKILPHKILALTFTKAAASEMSLRIQKKLREWTTLDEAGLTDELSKLLQRPAKNHDIESARQLFAEITDSPNGLNIMTIHSFCQSVLSRFPLESGISPQFKALEENEAFALLKKSYQKLLKNRNDKTSPLSIALHNFSTDMNEEQIQEVISSICSERYQIKKIIHQFFNVEGLYTNLCQFFDINPAKTKSDFLTDFCSLPETNENKLFSAIKDLNNGSKTDIERGSNIQKWLEQSVSDRINNIDIYQSLFLTNDGTIRSRLYTKTISENYQESAHILDEEALRILNLQNTLKSLKCATYTRDLFIIASAIIELYEREKETISALDFDDMILKTLDLLKGRSMQLSQEDMSPWVRFKLDQGIDHILVDEAQDTNPEQWEIIESLAYDFFDGESAQENNRTIFVVGDEKQSIFSFQRASPEKFNTMRDYFSEKIDNAKSKFDPIDINISFRSVSCILELVDHVFSNDEMRNGLGLNVLNHSAYRRGQPGLVELWPLFKNPEKEEINYWEPPVTVQESQSSASQLANHIASTIKKWLDTKEPLESHAQPIEAGDIMILMRSRNAFVGQLVKALKSNNIPVSGVDRMALTEELAVEDLLAAAQFSLLPDDDLTLACLLKSPFVSWSDDDLFEIAYNRNGSLWSSLKEKEEHSSITDWLNNLIQTSGDQSPYEFLNSILQNKCPSKQSGLQALKSRLGYECLDPIEELLNKALDYEARQTQSLQGFLQALQKEKIIIKREMEEAGKAVRIMTVHGSKGLQAPIVILPDTIRNSSSIMNEKIIWPDRSGDDLPYFIGRQKDAPEKTLKAIENIQKRSEDEYKRLLYVAMTRAENRLYIGGYTGTKKPLENSWYNFVSKSFDSLNGIEAIELENSETPIKRYKTEDSALKADRANDNKQGSEKEAFETPPWLFKKIPEEPFPPRPLVPSRPSEDDMTVSSPLKKDNNERFKRGNITHMLLQFLPGLPQDLWEEKAKQYVAEPIHDLSSDIQNSIVTETLKVLQHPDFAPIFGKGSIAEAPVTGLLDDKTLISGQIDRLLITDTDIYIIDFKTNRPPPTDEKNVPLLYKNQLKAYAKALMQIYPNRKIHTALLWTEEPRLMPLKVL